MDVVKAAREAGSPLASLPPMFTSFSRNGVDAALEFATPATLTASDRASIHALLDENMAPVYGSEGWTDAKSEKVKQLEEPETRLLLLRANAPASPATSPASSPTKDEAKEDTPEKAPSKSAELLGFLHFRFEIRENAMLLGVHDLQVQKETQRKGVGKFLMMLSEMIAKRLGMGGAIASCQRANLDAMAFFKGIKYGLDAISPVNIHPTAEDDAYNYELVSKVWDSDARQALDNYAAAEKKRLAGGGDAALRKEAEKAALHAARANFGVWD